MGKKIFISYKFSDKNVYPLSGHTWDNPTTVRSYVDALENYFGHTDNIYKGESNDEDLSWYSEDTIWEMLKKRIFDSSVTIVMISPNMRITTKSDKSQWIPWEVSFSLKETTRNDKTSHTNALLAIVLPDKNGSYDYYLTQTSCGSTIHHTDILFNIIRENKFNKKKTDKYTCNYCGCVHYKGECSYIEAVKWNDFIESPDYYINKAVQRQENKDLFDIKKEV